MDATSGATRDRRGAWALLLAAGLGFFGGVVGAGVVERVRGGNALAPGVDERRTAAPPLVPGGRGDDAVVRVVEEASPAVVAVIVSKAVPRIEEVPFDPFGDGFFGPSPFRLRLRRPGEGTERREVGGGSGFVVDQGGLIVTNRHVVADSEAEYDVVFPDGARARAEVVARDPLLDLALLRVEREGLTAIPLAASDDLRVGQTVIAIGNALGEFPNSVSVGVISGLGRQVRAGDRATGAVEVLDRVIQTDAAINPGNSGGPLLDLAGRAVGVNTAVAGGAENIGFAIPAREALRVVNDFRAYGRVVRPILGVRYVLISPVIQSELGLPVDAGALLVSGDRPGEAAVLPGSGAAEAGLVEGDIILEVDGQRVTVDQPLQVFIRSKRPGDRVTLTVLSGNERKTVSVTLTEAE